MFRNGPSIDRKKVAIALSIYAFGVACLFAFHYLKLKELAICKIDEEIRAGACAASSLLGDDYIERANEPGTVSKEEDMRNILRLSRLANDLRLKYVYTVVKHGRDFYFSGSSATDKELAEGSYVKYFDDYKEAPKALFEAYDSGQPRYAEYQDRWGTFRSAFLPIKTPSGKTYIACADLDLDKVKDRLRHALYASLLPPLLVLLLAAPLLWMHFSIERSHKRLLKEKQSQLVHAGRLTAMGEMAAGIAHEINQPLCVIRGYLELLQATLANDPTLKERQLDGAFEIGIKSVDKASRIINHMRSFVRLKSSEPKSVNLRTPIEEGLSFFNEQIRLHNIELDMKFADSVPEVRIDPQRFEQVVVNLVSNARYAVDEKSSLLGRDFKKKVELRLSHDKERCSVVFEVRDNGIGMRSDVLKRCGEPFFTTKKAGEGTGLGVSIVKEIVEDFEGRLEIESVEGEGSVFRVIFPVIPQVKIQP